MLFENYGASTKFLWKFIYGEESYMGKSSHIEAGAETIFKENNSNIMIRSYWNSYFI